MSATVDFYLDFISPFGYLARHRLAQMASRHGWDVRYHPLDLPRIKLAAGNNGPSNRQIPPKIRYLTTDLQRWARRYGIPMVEVLPGPDTARVNKGLFLAIDRGVADRYVEEAWNSIWRDGRDPGDEASLAGLATAMGWSAGEFLDFVASAEANQRYEESCDQAIDTGVFGVPTFIADNEIFWGNDRLEFLEDALSPDSGE